MDIQLAESFLKSLKASNDVELAISAWANENLYIPSKGQFLATWVLNTLLKNNSVIRDSRYWILLESILLGSSSSSPLWLPTLVYKTPVVPILAAILRDSAKENGSKLSKEMLEPCQRVLKVVIPIALPKTRLETVLDCFWATLDALGDLPRKGDISELVKIAVYGFSSAFSKATNKTKIYTSFVEEHFTAFARAILGIDGISHARDLIWAAVRDILCSFDSIKAISQQREFSGHGFFGALRTTCELVPQALQLCPRLFVDQITAARAHRSALSQANGELHAWQSYTAFESIFVQMDTEEAALARLQTLVEVEKHVGSGVREQAWINVLNSTALWCVESFVLKEAKNSDGILSSLTGSLAILGRMNYGLIESHLQAILKLLAYLPSENTSGHELYDVVISYHSKTRSLDNLSNQLFGVILHLFPGHTGAGDKGIAQNLTISSLMNSCLLGTKGGSIFSLALKQYTTPGQIKRIVAAVVSALQDTWRALKDTIDAGSHKGHEKSRPAISISVQFDSSVFSAALTFRMSSFVLPALPIANHASHQELSDWRNIIGDTIAIPCVRLTLDGCYVDNWVCQQLGASALRFISSLEGSSLSFEASQILEVATATSLENFSLNRTDILGELQLELARVLLRSPSRKRTSAVIQNILGHLNSTKSEEWNGHTTAMTAGTLNTGLTLLLTDRWLRCLELHATDDQLHQFATMIMLSCDKDHLSQSQSSIIGGALARRTLGNGLFWELPRLQSAMMITILNGTGKADSFESPLDNPFGEMQRAAIEELGQYFRLLLLFPFEAFKGGHSATLGRRALLIDMAASRSPNSSSFSTLETRTSCRLFASRCLQDPKSSFTNYIGNKRIIQFLAAAEPGIRGHPEFGLPFLQATNTILDLAFSVFIRQTVQLESNFEELFLFFAPLNDTALMSFQPSHIDGLARLLYNLANWWESADRTPEREASMHAFLTPLQDTLHHLFLHCLQERPSLLPALLRLARACLHFRYIPPSSVSEVIGTYTAAALSTLQSLQEKSDICENSLTELMSILVDAVDLASDDFDLARKMVSLHHLASSTYDIDLDASLQQGVRLLKPQIYEPSLKLLMEMLGQEVTKSLIQSLVVLIVNCPEGTFKIAQSTLSESLLVLNDICATKQVIDVELHREIIHYVLSLCTDKPAFIRIADVGSILALLASSLQPSGQRGLQTHPDIFHSIVKATTALVRNRRGLVLLSLPHLAVLFCLLFGSLTKPQPSLGHKQFRNISSRLPHWISLSNPLGGTEASLLSRLLVTMTTKTVTRSTRMNSSVHEVGNDAQSLAKPFGKHASCVLGAYIDLLNDPLLLLDRETRTELAPGLFALCGMLGEKGRDAMMPTLDVGGKAIFKNLWSSYEKQKYVGKG